MKPVPFAAASVLVLGAVAFVVWRSGQPPTAEVTTAKVSDVVASLAVSGVLESKNRTTVSSQLGGARITKVLVDIGDAVEVGDPLIEFDASEWLAQRQNAQAQIGQAAASLGLQEVNASSAEDTLAVSQRSLDAATDLRIAFTQAETNLNTARERLKQAEANAQRVRTGSRTEQVRQAEAQLERAKALYAQRSREADRSRKLFEEGAVSRAEFELAQTALETARQDVRVAEENLKLAARPRTEDVRQADAQVAEARAAVSGAQNSLALARKNLNDRLGQRLQVSQAQAQLNSARAQRQVSQAQITQAEAQMAAADANLAKTIIRAPFAGRIAQRWVEPGQTVAVGAALVDLANENALRVRLDVDEASLSRIKVGEKALISLDAYPDLKLEGVVSEVGSSANFQRGTVEVRIKLNSSDARLKPQLTADVNIITAEYRSAVVVPRRALVNPDSEPQVYVVSNGVVEARTVAWTAGDSDRAVILKGLKVGELLLISPRLTKPGQRVNPIAERPRTQP